MSHALVAKVNHAWLSSERANSLLALLVAAEAGTQGEIPVGALLVDDQGRILAATGNRCLVGSDPVGHAEMRALRRGALRTDNYRLTNNHLFVSLEPCPMCLAAMDMARLATCCFAAKRELVPNPSRLARQVVDYAPLAGEVLRFFLLQKREVLNCVAESVLMPNSDGTSPCWSPSD